MIKFYSFRKYLNSFLFENFVTMTSTVDKKKQLSNETNEYRVYKWRWICLFLFVVIFVLSSYQWIQYTIIVNIVVRFYGVSEEMINNTSIIYLVTYLPLVFPASYLILKMGLRYTVITAAAANFIGSWLKVPSAQPNRFYLSFIGQTVLSIGQLFILSIPPKIAAVWFSPDQISTACAIGVFGAQLGPALGFFVTPLIVHNHENIDEIGDDLYRMFLVMAIIATVSLIATIAFFRDKPPTPPSKAQEAQQNSNEENSSIFLSFKRLLTNGPFVMLLISYGINIGLFNTIGTLINPMILPHFPNGEQFAGQIGVLVVLSGIPSSILVGIILDKTKKYKLSIVVIYFLSVVGMILFSFSTLSRLKPLVYLAAVILGFFMSGYLAVGYEMAVELSYPEPEFNSSGVLNAISQTAGAIFTVIFENLIHKIGDFWTNMCISLLLLIGAIITILTPNVVNRQDAFACEKAGKISA